MMIVFVTREREKKKEMKKTKENEKCLRRKNIKEKIKEKWRREREGGRRLGLGCGEENGKKDSETHPMKPEGNPRNDHNKRGWNVDLNEIISHRTNEFNLTNETRIIACEIMEKNSKKENILKN